MDIRKKTCLIVKKNKEYLAGRIIFSTDLRWSIYRHEDVRTSATNNARRGMPVQHIQFLLGHENIDTTMEYVQTLGEDAKLKYMQFVG